MTVFISLVCLFTLPSLFSFHAIWQEPPGRASIGKLKPQCRLPVNVDHMSLYCGGFTVQHARNNGKCGICGDPYNGPFPHQAGGIYARGTIARSYKPGQIIDIEIDLVANHQGFFTFAICPHNDPHSSPDRSCFEAHPLKLFSPRISPYYATANTGVKRMRVGLPAGMTCKGCILQYTYTSGNNWGKGAQSAEVQSKDCLDPLATGRLGCGQQETFRGCADICIGDFCPKDPNTCQKVDEIYAGDGEPSSSNPITTRRPAVINTTRSPAILTTNRPTPATTWEWQSEPRCDLAGVKPQYYSMQGDSYCKKFCLNKFKSECFRGANTKFLCYCKSSSGRNPPVSAQFSRVAPKFQANQIAYKPVTVNVLERNPGYYQIW